ncbi:MAG: type II toxin-antitoxin system VapC family toxin [Euryarchaeota archaeon]|nr:type II toxin-antitoxin system VapC family toxin [Euryarchaeota archaeon]
MNLLDTSFVVDLLRGDETVSGFLDSESATTAVTYFEMMSFRKRRKLKAEGAILERFFSEVPVLPFTRAAAEEASAITARLMDIGRPVNALDVLIASIALSERAERLITRDRDFLEIAKICDLSVTIY